MFYKVKTMNPNQKTLKWLVLWYLAVYLREAGGKLGKNYPILERLVGETFMNQWKNIYPWIQSKFLYV